MNEINCLTIKKYGDIVQEKIKNIIWIRMKEAKELTDEDKEIYLFGLIQGVIFLLNTFTALCIGMILNMLIEVIIYLVCFIPIRIFAGGYHAKTQFRCYIMSTVTTFVALRLIKFLQISNSIFEIVVLIISIIIIWNLSPIEDDNKPLTKEEYSIYKIKVRKLISIILGVLIFSFIINNQLILSSIQAAIFILSLVIIIGAIKLKVN